MENETLEECELILTINLTVPGNRKPIKYRRNRKETENKRKLLFHINHLILATSPSSPGILGNL